MRAPAFGLHKNTWKGNCPPRSAHKAKDCEASQSKSCSVCILLPFRHCCTLYAYRARQNRLAGIKPVCDVFNAITQIRALFKPATSHPSQRLLPTRIVEPIVKTQEI